MATKRFLKNSPHFMKGYPGLSSTLSEFIEFKRDHPKSQFGKKDTAFTGGALRGQLHVHLVHGKVIVVYGIRDGQLRLYDMVEHNGFEGAAVEALAAYIRSIDPSMLADIGQTEEVSISSEEKREIVGLFYEMSLQDRDILKTALRGDTRDLMEFCRMVVDVPESVLEAAFKSEGGLLKAIAAIMRQTEASVVQAA